MPESLTLATLAGTNFSLIGGTGIELVEHSYPAPTPLPFYASSADTEGERFLGVKYGNRQISLVVECYGATSETVLQNLSAHVAQIGREGGTLTWVTPGGLTRIFDLVTWQGYQPVFDVAFSVAGVSRVAIELAAKPFWRGAAVLLADRVETTLPALVFTETSVTGDVPALGRLVIDEDQAVDQAWVVWGLQQKNYSSAAQAALFFQAEALTAQGGSATATGATGASGTAPNVMRNTDLTTSFVSVLSGQLSGGGAYLSHVGSFRVFARVYCPTGNTGTVKVALEWSEGDFRRATRNETVEYESAWEGSWRLLDLGSVSLTAVDTGTQRWEPRVLASSTVAGDEIDVDWLMFVPTDEGAGETSSVLQESAPSVFLARDEFNQSAGVLAGKTLPVGGAWTFLTGDTDDFNVSGSGVVTRATTTDSAERLMSAGTSSHAAISAQVDIEASLVSGTSFYAGLVVRWVDASNHVRVFFDWTVNTVTVAETVAGVTTSRTDFAVPDGAADALGTGTRWTLKIMVDAAGRGNLWVYRAGGQRGSARLSWQSAALATGGALATGRVGIMDWAAGASAITRTYDNFAVWGPPADAAMFASQSLTIHHDKARREDSGGTLSVKPSSYEGDYLLIPPTGPDARTTRIIVKASRNVPGEGADSGIDDISARLTYTPRGLVV